MPTHPSEFVTVYLPGDPVDQSIAESCLAEAEIPYFAKNGGVQALIGAGEIGGFNVATGGVEIQVPSDRLEDAREVLRDLIEAAREEEVPTGIQADTELATLRPEEMEKARRLSRLSMVWSILWFGGLGSLIAAVFGFRALSILRAQPWMFRRAAVFGIVLSSLGIAFWFTTWGLALLEKF